MQLKKGQILKHKDDDGTKKVLEILGDIYFLSAYKDHEMAGFWYTLKDIKEQFELPKEEWKPKEDNDYYFIKSFCGAISVCDALWDNDETDKKRLALGNCFKTKKEAEAALEKVKKALKE